MTTRCSWGCSTNSFVRASADREASINDLVFTRPGSGVTVLPVSALCQLTGKRPLPGRNSIYMEQRDFPGLVWEWLAGIGSGVCEAETNQSKGRERVPILFVLNEHDQEIHLNGFRQF